MHLSDLVASLLEYRLGTYSIKHEKCNLIMTSQEEVRYFSNYALSRLALEWLLTWKPMRSANSYALIQYALKQVPLILVQLGIKNILVFLHIKISSIAVYHT